MRRLKACYLALFAILVFGVVNTSIASAELEAAEVHIVLGESAPATAEGKLEGEKIATLETELGAGVTANKVELKVEAPKVLGSSGKGTVTLSGVKRGTKECWTEKPGKDETVVLEGEGQLVHVGDPQLQLGQVVTVSPTLTVLCGKAKELKAELKIKAEGSVISSLLVSNMKQITEGEGALKCTKPGVQELTQYLNNKDETVKAVLMVELGLGPEPACINVAKPMTLKSSRMVEFLF